MGKILEAHFANPSGSRIRTVLAAVSQSQSTRPIVETQSEHVIGWSEWIQSYAMNKVVNLFTSILHLTGEKEMQDWAKVLIIEQDGENLLCVCDWPGEDF